MRVLVVSHDGNVTGASNVLIDVVQVLSADNNVYTYTFCNHKKSLFKSVSRSYGRACRLSGKKFIYSFVLDILRLPIYLFDILNILKKHKIELIYWNTCVRLYIPSIIKYLSKVPIIIHAHEPDVFFEKRVKFGFLFSFWFRRLDRYIAVSERTKSNLISLGVVSSAIEVVYNGVNTNRQIVNSSLNSNVRNVIFIASELNYRKGFDLLVDFCDSYRGTKLFLDVFGRPHCDIDVNVLNKDFPCCAVILKGFKSLSSINFNKYDAAFFLSRSEANSRVPIELAAKRIPLVISDIPENYEIFDMSECWYFRSSNVHDLLFVFKELRSSSILIRTNKADAAYNKVVKKFDKDKNMNMIREIALSLCCNKENV